MDSRPYLFYKLPSLSCQLLHCSQITLPDDRDTACLRFLHSTALPRSNQRPTSNLGCKSRKILPKLGQMQSPNNFDHNITNMRKNGDTYHRQAGRVRVLVADSATSAVDASVACCSDNKLSASSEHRIHWLRLLVLVLGTSGPSADPAFHRQ